MLYTYIFINITYSSEFDSIGIINTSAANDVLISFTDIHLACCRRINTFEGITEYQSLAYKLTSVLSGVIGPGEV